MGGRQYVVRDVAGEREWSTEISSGSTAKVLSGEKPQTCKRSGEGNGVGHNVNKRWLHTCGACSWQDGPETEGEGGLEPGWPGEVQREQKQKEHLQRGGKRRRGELQQRPNEGTSTRRQRREGVESNDAEGEGRRGRKEGGVPGLKHEAPKDEERAGKVSGNGKQSGHGAPNEGTGGVWETLQATG